MYYTSKIYSYTSLWTHSHSCDFTATAAPLLFKPYKWDHHRQNKLIIFYIPVYGQIKEACWVIKKISPSGFGVRQLAPFKASIEAIYQLPLLITRHDV